MQYIEPSDFLVYAFPALSSDEGPPFAREPELHGHVEFDLRTFAVILIRRN